MTRAQEAEENYLVKRELATVKQQSEEAGAQLEQAKKTIRQLQQQQQPHAVRRASEGLWLRSCPVCDRSRVTGMFPRSVCADHFKIMRCARTDLASKNVLLEISWVTVICDPAQLAVCCLATKSKQWQCKAFLTLHISFG